MRSSAKPFPKSPVKTKSLHIGVGIGYDFQTPAEL